MQKGPTQSQQSSQSSKQHTPFSKMFGAVTGAIGEQVIFHPIDTAGKSLMTQTQGLFPWLRQLLTERGPIGVTKQLYGGLGVALVKKPPMRWYKYGVQDTLNETMTSQYQEAAKLIFGPYFKVVIQCAAGATTGLFEPVFFQGIDTAQIRKQVLKEKITLENAQKLGFKGLYRGALFTGLARNVPGSIGLFGGSAYANHLMSNDNYQSQDRSKLLNLGAKWFGALTSLILSQPGDVIKTNMQVKQVPLKEAFQGVTAKQLFTGGLGPRLFMSFKVGVGFFLIEECMNYSRILFGKDSEALTEDSRDVENPTVIVEELTESTATATCLTTQYDAHKSKSRLVDDEPTFDAYDDPLMNDLAKQLKKCRIK